MGLFSGTKWDVPPTCDRCGDLESECQCEPLPPPANIVPPSDQRLRISLEKRKKGKVVTLVTGLAMDDHIDALLTKLKNVCGSGGTIRDGVLEIQGDHQQRLIDQLSGDGYRIAGRK